MQHPFKLLLAALGLYAGLVLPAAAQPRHAADRGRILPHPTGCPARDFCGCGVSVWAFGHPVRSLFAARAWRRFPRDRARAGNVAVFGRRHVAGIVAVLGPDSALVYDPNSGRHRTRLHRRSLEGALIVNPHAARSAAR